MPCVPFHQAVSQGAGHSHRTGGRHRRGPARGPARIIHAKDLRAELTLCERADTSDWDHWDYKFEYFKVGKRCRTCVRLTKED
jgi:hypothetical protein